MIRSAILATSAVILLSASSAIAQDAQPPAPPPPPPATTPPAAPPPSDVPPPFPPPPPRTHEHEPERSPEKKDVPGDIGGHLGFALPIGTIGGRKNVGIGADFVTVGLTPGITVHLDEKWAVDFEFIAFNEFKNTPAATTFIVDPGIIRKFDGFVAGLRVATQVGAPTNSGLVPIFVLPFKIGKRAVWFAEADLPLFIRDVGDKALFSATFLFQSGVGF